MPKAATLGEVTMAETEPMMTVVKVITLRCPGWREDCQNHCLQIINNHWGEEDHTLADPTAPSSAPKSAVQRVNTTLNSGMGT
eukprot:14559311-Ditylum_brightwellii.AAC.1